MGGEEDLSRRAFIVGAAAALAIFAANMAIVLQPGSPYAHVTDYRDSIADMVPRLAAAAAYPDGDDACRRVAAAEIAGIADDIMLDPHARKDYPKRGGQLALMDAAVDEWLYNGGKGGGWPATQGCGANHPASKTGGAGT